MTHLVLSSVSASYGSNVILDQIDLSVEKGEMHVLLGPSGCGKTTLLRSIAGLVQPDKGSIRLGDRAIEKLHPKDRGIGMVFQHYALFPNMTVRQNLAFGLEQKRLPRKVIDNKVEEALATVSLLERADARPRELSGGQKQRVALARALVLEPALLLLDEPLSALDAQIRKRLRDELKRIQRQTGLTSILVTHDQDEALSLGDRISVMDRGRIAQTGSGPEIFYRPADLFVARFIGNANILEADEAGRLGLETTGRKAVVQPHMFSLHPPKERDTTFAAVVSETIVSGGLVRYMMRANDVTINVEAQTGMNAAVLNPGSMANIAIAPGDVHFID